MRQYYIILDNQQIGPYTIEVLKDEISKGVIKRDTPVWFEGKNDWDRAGEVEELKEMFVYPPPFKAVPPPFYVSEETKKSAINFDFYHQNKVNIHRIGIVIILLFLLYKAFWIKESTPPQESQNKQEIIKQCLKWNSTPGVDFDGKMEFSFTNDCNEYDFKITKIKVYYYKYLGVGGKSSKTINGNWRVDAGTLPLVLQIANGVKLAEAWPLLDNIEIINN